MSINFIKSIAKNEKDERAHRKFIRYSVGEFEKEKIHIKRMSNGITLSAGFEYLDVFLDFISRLINDDDELILKGVIVSNEKIDDKLDSLSIEPKKKRGKKYTIDAKLSPKKFREMLSSLDNSYLLLDLISSNYKIKVKKSIPKPGKLQEKFVVMKLEKKDWDFVKDEFLFDCDRDGNNIIIKHNYIIEEIIIPPEYKDNPEMARVNALRKGKIIREITVDGVSDIKEINLLV